jgi:hypothetical protein
MPAQAPRAVSVDGFPEVAAEHAPDYVFRIFQPVDPVTGNRRAPWFFSSSGSRFDLPAPGGTCYFSDHRYGAWLEVFRGCGLVDRADVERRALLAANRTGEPLRLADLRAPAARGYGVTTDLAAGDDYALCQEWASCLHGAGFAGLCGTIRHDPTHRARNVALFGRKGARWRVKGWRTTTVPLIEDPETLREVAPFGTGVVGRPYDVTITPVR